MGRYIIVDTIGVGGMGIVYSAFDPDLDRKVALKLLKTRQGDAARTRLLREAQAMAKLSHSNVVTVFEVGTSGQRDFVAMEFVDGEDLAGWAESPRDTASVLGAYLQAGEGLAAAHRAGLVHRDFKPQNVLIDTEGKVLVTDFGLARHASSAKPAEDVLPVSKDAATLTKTGAIMGTPAYMSPEQHLAQEADARSDQFSFCVALYESLCGRRPYEDETFEKLREAVTEGEPTPMPDSADVSASVRAALAKGMSRRPEDRFDSMEALLQALTPKQSRRALLVGVSFASVVVALILISKFMGGAETPRCQFDRSMLEGVWDDGIRANVESSFSSTGVEGQADVVRRLESILDGYSDDVVQMRTDVCKSSTGRRGQADADLVLRMGCLQRRQQDLSSLTRAFSSVDPSGVDRVIEAALSLSPVSDCGDTAALQRGVPAAPAAVRTEVEELQQSLKTSKLEGEAGHVKAAIARAEAANLRSLKIGYLPLQAESYEALGHLYVREVRMKDAEKAYEEAILAAEESGYTEYRARALVGLTQLVATGSSRYDEARRLARRAKAAIVQGGGDADLQADVDLSMANILIQEGSLDDALDVLEPSLRHYLAQSNAKAIYIARLQNQIAGVKIELGAYEEAHALAVSSYEHIRAELGDSHPRTAAYLSTLSITHRMRGEFSEARSIDQKLRTYWARDSSKELLKEDDEYSDKTRSIRGRVVGPGGEPIGGATVVCSPRIVADTHYLDASWNARGEAAEHCVRTESQDDGAFLCADASQENIVVAAEHPRLGRSGVLKVSKGSAEVGEVALVVGPTGFLSGHVTEGGRPAGPQAVSAVPVGDSAVRPSFAVVAFLHDDGSYTFERLAPGRYNVFSGPQRRSPSRVLKSLEVKITAGAGAVLDFEHSEGDAGVTVQVVGKGGVVVPSAQVLLVRARIDPKTGSEFNRIVVKGGLDVNSQFWIRGSDLEMSKLHAGAQTLCVVALAGDFRDPEYMKTVTPEMLESVPVHCQPIDLVSGESPTVRVEVPALRPVVKLQTPPEDSAD